MRRLLILLFVALLPSLSSAQRLREQHIDTETLCVGAGCGQSFCALLPFDSTKEILLCDSTEISGYLNTNDGLKLIDGGTNVSVSIEAGSASGNPLVEYTNGQPQTWQAGLRGTDESFVFSDATAGKIPFYIKKASSDNLLVLDGNYVGIGTASPAYQLHIYSASDSSVYERIESDAASSAAATIYATDTRTTVSGIYTPGIAWGVYDDTAATAPFTIAAGAPTYSLYVDTGGVGIGTNTPGSELQVHDAVAGAELEVTGATGTQIFLADGDAGTDLKNANVFLNSGLLRFRGVNDARSGVTAVGMNLDLSTGHVGIGTTSPNARVTIEGVLSLDETSAPTSTAGYGKVWTATDDELYFQDGGGVTHVLTPAYGGIYVTDNATVTSIAASSTYYQVTVFDSTMPSLGTTPSAANDDITVGLAGDYDIVAAITIDSSGGSGSLATIELKKNNGATALGGCHNSRTMAGGGGESGAVPISCIVTLAASDTVEMWVKNETNADDYVFQDASLKVVRQDI